MSKLSDRVYNLLMQNAKEPSGRRPNVSILGGANPVKQWKEPKNLGHDISFIGDKLNKRKFNNRIKENAEEIEKFNVEKLTEPIDYMDGGGLVGGVMVGGYCKNCGVKLNKKVVKKKMSGGNEALQYYNKCLNHIKSKGYSHSDAREILKQIKENEPDLYGGSWKSFWHGFTKGIGDVAKVAVPIVSSIL